MEYLVGLVIIVILLNVILPRTKKKTTFSKRNQNYAHDYFEGNQTEARVKGDQADKKSAHLILVEKTKYMIDRPVKPGEAKLLYKIENWIEERNQNERVYPQVPMGTYLKTPDDDAYKAICYKYPDFLIVDHKGWPICVVEYQGENHFQGNAVERDTIKKAALKNAGIPFVEVFASEKNNTSLILNKLNEAIL